MQHATMNSQLKAIRKQHKLNQTQFAERLHVTQQAVSYWERGKGLPAAPSLIKICQTFHIPIERLIQSA